VLVPADFRDYPELTIKFLLGHAAANIGADFWKYMPILADPEEVNKEYL
jgi:hypothetical protein